MPDPKPTDRTDEILKALAQLQEKTAPKPKPPIAAADRFHPFTEKATGAFTYYKLLVLSLKRTSVQ